MKHLSTPLRAAAAATLLAFAASGALAQAGATGQGGLSPDTPTVAPTPPGASTAPDAQGRTGPRTPLPPSDTPRAPQPGQDAAAGGPKTPLPSRDTPRAQQPDSARQAAAPDPDWPCVQVKVPALSFGQFWSGPSPEEAMRTWREDRDVAEVVSVLVARRTPMDEAKSEIEKFAKDAGDKKQDRLTLLFAGVFEEINGQRNRIMTGIERYSRKQRTLSERIKEQSLKLAAANRTMEQQNSSEGQREQQQLDWDTRIYDERQHSLTYVCETPTLLEQRVFDLSREIQTHLD